MNNPAKQPDPEMIKRHVAKLREVVCQFDTLNLLLDEAIAQAVSLAKAAVKKS